jgi:hypothetical protein
MMRSIDHPTCMGYSLHLTLAFVASGSCAGTFDLIDIPRRECEPDVTHMERCRVVVIKL